MAYITAREILRTGSPESLVGAGGTLEFEIDPMRTVESAKYPAYALFEALTNFSLWAVQKGKDVAEAVERFGEGLMQVAVEIARALEQEAERIILMNRILGDPAALEYAPPETKGMILYQLTRHGLVTKALSMNYDLDSLDTLGRRKRAVMTVTKKARDKAEFRNVCQHMTADGSKDAKGWEANYLHLQRFLGMGIDFRDANGNLRDYFENDLAALYNRLYDQPVLGYPFVDNDARAYAARTDMGHHEGYLVAGGYDPGPAMPRFPDDLYPEPPDTRYA